MQVRTSLAASGSTHPGRVREHNEDRFHYDPARGIFMVIDGVGGQAAGEKAADTALRKIREGLETEAGSVESRIRQAITAANNEILRLSALRSEWKGMACVLTVVVLDEAEAVVGHVGDTRLYKIRAGRIEKATRDHSPVGEREDAGDLSEADAMRHPRRNEVYRDVGSEEHRSDDADFIDVFRMAFENDAALVLCSDGLTDLVGAETIRSTVEEHAGHPYEVVRTLIDAANDAGGKDNVTVVYVEGARFAQGEDTGAIRRHRPSSELQAAGSGDGLDMKTRGSRWWRRLALVVLLAAVIAWSVYQQGDLLFSAPTPGSATAAENAIVVRPGESIAAALDRARPGTWVIVESGEYREQLRLKSGVSVRSRLARGAAIRLPGTASEAEAAIVADDVVDVELRGFRIIGDAATPLGTAVFIRNSNLNLTDIAISGARTAAVVFAAGATGALVGSDLHDNPGMGIVVRTGAEPRIAANTFARNAGSERTAGTLMVETGSRPEIRHNVFVGITREAILGLSASDISRVAANNWFLASGAEPQRRPARGRQGQR